MTLDFFQGLLSFDWFSDLFSAVQLLKHFLALESLQILTIHCESLHFVARLRIRKMSETEFGHLVEKLSHFG